MTALPSILAINTLLSVPEMDRLLTEIHVLDAEIKELEERLKSHAEDDGQVAYCREKIAECQEMIARIGVEIQKRIADAKLARQQAEAVESAVAEWESVVRENGEANRGEAVDKYVDNAGVDEGSEWCGAFVGYALEQAGFKHAPNIASRTKARDYFLYRDPHSKPGSDKNGELDELRANHEASGSGREFYILEDSDSKTAKRAKTPGIYGEKKYDHYDVDGNTHDHSELPIRPGDVALYNRGHVGIVQSYDPTTGVLVTLEGNAGGGELPDGTVAGQDALVRKTYDLTNEEDRKQFEGFGRPSASDFEAD